MEICARVYRPRRARESPLFRLVAHGKAADVGVGVIGPVTEQAARAAGLDVRVVASPATAEGLVHSIRRHFQQPA